jgi:hypothetical protein
MMLPRPIEIPSGDRNAAIIGLFKADKEHPRVGLIPRRFKTSRLFYSSEILSDQGMEGGAGRF